MVSLRFGGNTDQAFLTTKDKTFIIKNIAPVALKHHKNPTYNTMNCTIYLAIIHFSHILPHAVKSSK